MSWGRMLVGRRARLDTKAAFKHIQMTHWISQEEGILPRSHKRQFGQTWNLFTDALRTKWCVHWKMIILPKRLPRFPMMFYALAIAACSKHCNVAGWISLQATATNRLPSTLNRSLYCAVLYSHRCFDTSKMSFTFWRCCRYAGHTQ